MHLFVFLLIKLAFACDEDSNCAGNKICKDGKCEQKYIFPLTGNEILGTCLLFVSSGLAGASGIGGSILFIVFFVTLFSLNSTEAVALSQFAVIGSSLMASSIKGFLRHPTRKRPLIDYDIIVIIICPLLIGATIGVIVNIILPYWAILLVLTGLLNYLSIGTFRSGIRLYKKESSSKVGETKLIKQDSFIDVSEELRKFYEKEAKERVPVGSILIIFAVYCSVILITLLKGSGSFPSIIGIRFCFEWYWILMGAAFVILGVFSYYNSVYVIGKYKKKVEIGYQFDSGDIKWEKNTCLRLNFVGFMAGFFGSIIGVGALILNPTLMKFNVRPEVMTATTSFMVVFTSTISALQYFIAGKFYYDYGLWSITFSMIGSALGVFVIKGCVDKHKRSSLITLTLAFVMVLSGIITPVYGIFQIWNDRESDYGFHSYC